MKTFAQNLASLMPAGITLPPELIETFDWLEDQGWHTMRNGGQPEDHTLFIYPKEERDAPSASMVAFGGTTLQFTSHWSTPDASVDARVAEIATTSGDGGRAALWLDDDGKQQFVHIGHDNIGHITDDPLVFLQFLAMGYIEPGGLALTDITPMQAALYDAGAETPADLPEDETPIMPTALQAFLKTRFDLDMPATAADLGITEFPEYHEPDTTDPFAKWLNATMPEPTQEELDYMEELVRTVEELDLKDTDSSQTLMQKIGSLFRSKD
jgi:hypothetical protein